MDNKTVEEVETKQECVWENSVLIEFESGGKDTGRELARFIQSMLVAMCGDSEQDVALASLKVSISANTTDNSDNYSVTMWPPLI